MSEFIKDLLWRSQQLQYCLGMVVKYVKKIVFTCISAFLFVCLLGVSIVLTSNVTEVIHASETFESTIIRLVNKDREGQGLLPVTKNNLLTLAAQKKANDMAKNAYFSHTSPTGETPWHWFTAVGYYYTHAGENLAINFTDPVALERAWMKSPTHRKNIVKGVYTEIGIGIAYGKYKEKDTVFIAEFFATPQSFTCSGGIYSCSRQQ